MGSRAPSPTEPLSFEPAQAEPRRRFLLAATSTLGGLCAVATALPFLDSMMPSERALAAGAPVEADLAGLRDGDLRVVGWRGKPVWLLKRSASMLEQLGNHDALLVDPQSQIDQQPSYCRNTTRSIRPKYSSLSGSARISVVPPRCASMPHRPSWVVGGRVGSSALATDRSSISPDGCSRTCPRRPTWRFRRIVISATHAFCWATISAQHDDHLLT